MHEIYQSIQGESTYAGLGCVFVRLTGCPLRCEWCDTPHAFTEGEPMSVPQVLRAVEMLPPRLVELTGGEPLAQPECLTLMAALADTGRKVLLETSGAIDIGGVEEHIPLEGRRLRGTRWRAFTSVSSFRRVVAGLQPRRALFKGDDYRRRVKGTATTAV